MSSVSAIDSGLQGIHKGLNGIRKNARDIANLNNKEEVSGQPATAGGNDVADSLVDMKLNKLQVEASAKVVQTSADMIGTLIDMKA